CGLYTAPRLGGRARGPRGGRRRVRRPRSMPAIQVLVLDVDGEGAGHEPPHSEEAQTALVLLVVLVAGVPFDDPRVEQGDGFAVGCTDERGRTVDADLRCGDADSLGEGVDLLDALDCRSQL